MGPTIDLRIKTLDVGIAMLLIESNVKTTKHSSPTK